MITLPNPLCEKLKRSDQLHLLQYWDELKESEQAGLLGQLQAIDWDVVANLAAGGASDIQKKIDFEELEPPRAFRSDDADADWTVAEAVEAGTSAIKAGTVAVVMVAGGQGTRLGFEHPKGMYPIGPVSNRTLFHIFIDRIKATSQRYGVSIPLYLMTSDATHRETRDYFEAHRFFGLPAELVTIFKQGTMPAVDAATGRCLLASPSSLALSPDGHGGTLAALQQNGCLDDAERRGVKHLAYIQVDNPLAQLCDPVFLGHHLLSKSEMTTQVVKKRHPLERVGNVVRVGDEVRIVEYSDLPDELAFQKGDDGELRFWAGNIAVHWLELSFLKQSLLRADTLPYHRAIKKVPCLDSRGHLVEPATPNAVKFERFIFDLLPHAKNALVVESDPRDSFAPVKNAAGAETDTAELAKAAMCDLHRSWLAEAGVMVSDGVKVEISPHFALDSSELGNKVVRGKTITEDCFFGETDPHKGIGQ